VGAAVGQSDRTCDAEERTPAVAGSAEERGTTPAWVAAVGQNDTTCDAEEEAPAVEAPDALHTATGRSALREEAPTFVPSCLAPVPPSMLHSGVPYQDEFLQMGSKQMCRLDAAHDEFPIHQHTGCRPDECTTVMLRNLPCAFLREYLIAQMDEEGFAGLYNLVYMPIDFKTAQGMGYAFVNLVSADVVPRFVLAFDGFRRWPFPSLKVCTVQLSRTQGLDANVQRYRNSLFMGEGVPEQFRPVLFNGTSRIPMPPPTVAWSTRERLQ
jgi:hypothetical protein